jgi:hypothetical protein
VTAITVRIFFCINLWKTWHSGLGYAVTKFPDDIGQSMGVGEAICILREVIAVVNRPQDIEDDEAMAFFGGEEGDADESQG